MKHIIIGGVAGGATAAARIRRTDEKAEIFLLEKGKYISYANCGLPYYIGGTIAEREKLFMQTPASFAKRFNIDVRVENEVIGIDTTKKRVEVRRADGSTYTENYDKMLLSPGASPVRPPLKGIEIEGIFTLRNIEDTDRIKEHISSHRIGSTVIVGAGFIGLEMAENLHRTGAEVSVVEMGNQVMAPVDFSIAAHVHQHLSQKGIKLYLERSVERFERQGEKIEVFFSTGESITTDIVLLSIGVHPETTLAKAAGLKIGETGGIWVDDYLQTSATDVYAVGDAIEFPHPLTGKPWLNYLANPANRQGRIAADNMVFGNTTKYEGAIGTSIAKVFDMTVASTGLAAKRLKQSSIPYASSTTHSASHAGYYPDALPLTIKLTFDPASGKLYGGQCVGYEGVDKRIDQIALIIKNGGTVYDLMKVEHTYAPPFSSAKDPIVTRTAATAMDRRMDTDTLLGSNRMKTLRIDACGLQCPGPVMKIKQAIDSITEGERIEMVATDAGFSRDAQAWCDTTGNRLISNSEEKGKYTVIIEKGSSGASTMPLEHDAKGKTLIMFSDDLDKALATFVLANGAAATGQPVTIFFTFWGLSRPEKGLQ